MNRRKPLCMMLVAFVTLSLVTGVTTAHGRYTPDSTRNSPFSHDDIAANNSSVSIHHEGTPLVLHTAGNQTIRGETTLDPGTKLKVQVQATRQFFLTDSATVQPDGMFNTSFNLSEYDPGTKFSVTVGRPRNNSTEIDPLATIDGVLHARSTKSPPNSMTTTATTATTATTTTTTSATRTSTTAASTTSSTPVANRTMTDTTDSATETMTADRHTTSDGQPGFGIVAALLALACVCFARRNT